MHVSIRLLGLTSVLLLAACSSNAPVSQAVTPPQSSTSEFFNPTADDVLFRAIGLVGTPYVWVVIHPLLVLIAAA